MKKEENKHRPPDLETWRRLYEAALKFKAAGCWDWLSDADIFGVQDPASGETGYCCVMGGGGEYFGLSVFLGTAGLAGCRLIQSREIPLDDPDIVKAQLCLQATFDSKKYLGKPDLEIIKKLGLEFRGKNAWPQFRELRPGYLPWYLNQAQAEYLILCLEQSLEVALRFKENTRLLDPPEEGQYLVRVRDGSGQWSDRWLTPAAAAEEEPVRGAFDRERLEKIGRIPIEKEQVWEVDFFYFPSIITDRDRPYFPYGYLVVESQSYFILDVGLEEQAKLLWGFPTRFLDLLAKTGFRPGALLVKRPEVMKTIEPIARELGIELRQAGRLPAVEEVRRDMAREMGRRGPRSSDETTFADETWAGQANRPMRRLLKKKMGKGQAAAVGREDEGDGQREDLGGNPFEGKLMDGGKCVCDLCGKAGRIGGLAESREGREPLVACYDCVIEMSAERQGISKAEAKRQRAKAFKTPSLFCELKIKEFAKLAGEKALAGIDELNRVTGYIMNVWNSFGKEASEGFEAKEEAELREIYGRIKMNFSFLLDRPKFGRNDPCPCGSGKKYKKCCLIHEELEEAMTAEWKKADSAVVARAMALIETPGWLDAKLLIEHYWGEKRLDRARKNGVTERDEYEFNEWLMNDYYFSAGDDAPYILGKLRQDETLSAVERQVVEARIKAPKTVWLITLVKRGRGVLLRNIFDQQEVFVHDKLLSESAHDGYLVCARVLEIGSINLISGTYAAYSPPCQNEIRKVIAAERVKLKRREGLDQFLRRHGYIFGRLEAALRENSAGRRG